MLLFVRFGKCFGVVTQEEQDDGELDGEEDSDADDDADGCVCVDSEHGVFIGLYVDGCNHNSVGSDCPVPTWFVSHCSDDSEKPTVDNKFVMTKVGS